MQQQQQQQQLEGGGRSELLEADFAGCMQLLHNYPSCDVNGLLHLALHIATIPGAYTSEVDGASQPQHSQETFELLDKQPTNV